MNKFAKLTVMLSAILLALPVVAAKPDLEDKKGHGAGGMRADHASEQGMEHGKAYAGSKEKQVKEMEENTEQYRKEKKEQKEKKERKEKKNK